MTNEALVKAIQNGERDKIPELWLSVKGFIAKRAKARMWRSCGGYDIDDLIQSGFIAMVAAAETHDIDCGASFITWLDYHLKTAFAEAENRKTERQQNDPMHNASSLYAPLYDDEETYLLDTIPGDDVIAETEEKIYSAQLRSDLEAILSTIPEENAEVLRLYFFEGKPMQRIAERQGVDLQTAYTRKKKALQTMRQKTNTADGQQLKAYLADNTNYYIGTGLTAFLTNRTSAVEATALRREHLKRVFVHECC